MIHIVLMFLLKRKALLVMNFFIKRIIFISVLSCSMTSFCPFKRLSTLFLLAAKRPLPLLPVLRPLLQPRRISVVSTVPKVALSGLSARISLSKEDLSNFVFTSLKKNIKTTDFQLSAEKGLISSTEYLFQVQVFLLSEMKSLVVQNDDSYLYRIFIGNEPEIRELQDELMIHNTSIHRDIFVHRDSTGATIVSRNSVSYAYGFMSLAVENIAQQLREELIGQHYIVGC